jgi:hypothetical protein
MCHARAAINDAAHYEESVGQSRRVDEFTIAIEVRFG